MDLIVGVAVIGALLLVWFGYRTAGSGLPPELEEAVRLEKSDPARSVLLADSYFTREAERAMAERRQLWERASNDLNAAYELRRHLQEQIAKLDEIIPNLQDG